MQPDDKMIFTKDSFSQQGNFPPVEDNVFLIKGLYSDSLPPFLKQQKVCLAFAACVVCMRW